jgi:hypothetical protein
LSSAYRVTVQPTVEPITLIDAKAYLRVDGNDEDTVIAQLITRARAFGESVTHRALATQTIRQEWTLNAAPGGTLSGPFDERADWYIYGQVLGSSPFGTAPYYFDLAMPPVQSLTSVETRDDVFSTWTTFTGTTSLDSTMEPARLYVQDPVSAEQWRAIFVTGYNTSYPVQMNILQALYETVAYLYDNRGAQYLPESIVNRLSSCKVDWI